MRRISLREAIQITQARSALESLIAAEAARHVSADDHADLQQVIDDIRSAVATERGGDYSVLNGVLHRRLREMSGHEIAAAAMTYHLRSVVEALTRLGDTQA